MVTEDVVAAARAAASDLLGAASDEVIFGANMTTLNFALAGRSPVTGRRATR